MKSTFDNRKLQKIQNLNFDLKAPGEGILSYLNKRYMHRKYTIHEYQKIERSITINKATGNIQLNLLTKETINETLNKRKNKRKNKICILRNFRIKSFKMNSKKQIVIIKANRK